jgi:hypothetical protein
MDEKKYVIIFAESTADIYKQDRRSAILNKDTNLYQLVSNIRVILEKKYGDLLQPLRMDYHIALMSYNEMKSDEYKQLLETRYKLISGTDIIPTYGFINKAFVLWTTAKSHITLGWFPGGHPPEDELKKILKDYSLIFVECNDPLGE